ncbi:MAG TPA: cytochrome c oxidase subunit 4 [Acidothermaceae bacterium]|jgi:hypothetical protein
MKVEGLLFAGVAIFFAGIDIVYWYTSHDPTGTTALALAVALGFLVGFYLFITGRRTGIRPEDRPNADISEAAGEVGFFSPHSWWPLFTAGAISIVAVGVVFAWWLAIVGLMCVVITALGFVLEYYRGVHQP